MGASKSDIYHQRKLVRLFLTCDTGAFGCVPIGIGSQIDIVSILNYMICGSICSSSRLT